MLSTVNINKFWQKRNILHYLLLPFSIVWLLLGYLRKFQKPYKSSLFIICIGNINLGGSGKTPTAILVARMISETNYSAVFLSKGYKGSIVEPTWVTNKHKPIDVGDEPLLLAKVLPTLVSKNLKKGLQFLEKSKKAQIIIIDDGYQNPSIIKDFNILVVNGFYQFGNEFIFPAGPLRETIHSGILKANALVVLENTSDSITHLANLHKIDIYNGFYKPTNILQIDQKVLAFCGIGIPEKFLHTLEKNNIKVDKLLTYPDHYRYTKQDILNIIATAKDLQILTTEKDYVKIPKEYANKFIPYAINLELTNKENLLKQITTHIKYTL